MSANEPRASGRHANDHAGFLLITVMAASLLAGLGPFPPSASAGGAAPQPLGLPASGWISDVPVAADSLAAESDASVTTAASGDLYMAFQSNAAGNYDIYFTESGDGGLTWTPPVAVTSSATNEVSPSIAQDPYTGRTYIAYMFGISGSVPIRVAYSDDRITWTERTVLGCGVRCERPRIASEYWRGASNVQYVALAGPVGANDWNVAIARSLDDGNSWTWYESGLGPADVRFQPDVAVQRGTDGIDRVFAVYRGGATVATANTLYVEWSTTYGASWAARANWFANVVSPPAIAASHDGTSLLVAYGTSTPEVAWAQAPYPQSLTTFNGTADVLPTLGSRPAVSADGVGMNATGVGGAYNLVAHDTAGALFHVQAPVTLTSNADWSAATVFTDAGAIPSVGAPDLSVTAQYRGTSWNPAVAWTDQRAGNDDVYYTTRGTTAPGTTNVTIDTVPTGLRVTLDGITRAAPATFLVANGTHRVGVSSPQAGAPGWRYAFASWSDGGAISHNIAVTGDMALTVSFSSQVLLTLNSAQGGVACDTVDCWYDLGATATITATSPQSGGVGVRYRFDRWTGDVTSTSLSATLLMDAPKTVDANWWTQYYLTVSSPYGGVTGAGWYDAGASATFTVTSPQAGSPGTRYEFTDWSGDAVSAALSGSVTMDAPKTVAANWKTQFLLTVVSAWGGVAGAGWYDQNAAVTLLASSPQAGSPGTRYVFAAWTGDVWSMNFAITFPMDAPKTVTANWNTEYYLAVNTGHGGATASGWFPTGTRVTVRVNATEVVEGGRTWLFTGWSGDATGADATVNVTMTGPLNVTAMWQEKPVDLFAGPSGALVIGGILLAVLAGILVIVFARRRRQQAAPMAGMPPVAAAGPVGGETSAPPAPMSPQEPGAPPPTPPIGPPP